MTEQHLQNALISVDDCILISIDIQDGFLSKYDAAATQEMIAKNVWLIKVARHLGVPIVAVGEDIPDVGNLNEQILDALGKAQKIHSKDAFNLADNPEILADVVASGRKTAVLVGMETDVCVAQSALGLLSKGYQVVAVKDAMITTAADEDIGRERMRNAGVVMTSAKALYYEWIRSVSKAIQLDEEAPELRAARPSLLVM